MISSKDAILFEIFDLEMLVITESEVCNNWSDFQGCSRSLVLALFDSHIWLSSYVL